MERVLTTTRTDRCILLLCEEGRIVPQMMLDSRLQDIRIREDCSRPVPEKVLRTGEAVCIGRRLARDGTVGILYVDNRSHLSGLSASDFR